MNTVNKEETYITFLECLNKAQEVELLYKDTFEIISKLFNFNRVQIWEKVIDSNLMSVLHEFTLHNNETSLLKFRIPALSNNLQKKFEGTTIWEYQNITDHALNKFNILSLIGIEYNFSEHNKGIFTLTSEEKDKKLNNSELSYLIKLKNHLELRAKQLYMLNKSIDEAKRLQNHNITLREQDRLRTEFINNTSHEFRTPLASILGFTKMLYGKDHSPESTQEISEQIHHAANRLASLITDFLQINKKSNHAWDVETQSCDIGEIIKKCIEEFSCLNKNHKFSYTISNNYPVLSTDPRLIRQLLDNLISNAIKYSPEGGNVLISVQVSADNKELQVSVSDQGIGIGKEEISKIFNRTYRSTNPKVQKVEGTGLGLAICREIITTLNGKIVAESEVDKGSKFIFTLPVA